MSVPAGDVTTEPLGKLLQPMTNEELPSMVIDTDGVVYSAPILSAKEICQDTATTVATTEAHALQSKECPRSIAMVSQPVTLFGPEEVGLNAIEHDSLSEVNIASHLPEAVEEGVQIFAPEAQHELYNAADQQSSHPSDPEITGTVVSTEIPDDVKSDTGLPDPLEDTSKVSVTEAFTIAEVKDINVDQDSSVFASGKNNSDIQLPSAEETDQDTAVDSPSIPAETGVELHEETLNPGNESGIVHESDVSSTTAPESILGDGNTTNERSAGDQKQDDTEVSKAGHVPVAPESVNEVVTVELESDKGEISVAGPPIVDKVLLSVPPSETVKGAVAHEAEKPPTIADAIQVSKLEPPSPVYHVVEIEAAPIDPSLNQEPIETVAAHKVDAAILPVTDISGTGDITADGLGISSELVDAPRADVQDIPLESVSQAVQEEQFVRESGIGPEETPLPSEDDILDHALEVETLSAETLVDVAKPATTQAFEEVGIVEEILAPEIPEELVRASQDPMAILALSSHKAEDSSSVEAVLPDTANGVAEAAGHIPVDLHSAASVHHTVAVVEDVAVDNLETQATPVVASEPFENKKVVLVEETLVNTQPVLDDEVVVMDTSSVSEAEAGGPDECNTNENGSLKAELEATQIFCDDADGLKATAPKDLLVEKLGVEGLFDTKKVSLDGEDCQVASDSEFSEPPADASTAPVTAVFTDEQTVQIAEHNKDVTGPTLAKQGEVFEGETVDFTIAQPLSNEFATYATASDRSDVQAKTSATAPGEDALVGEAKEHAQDLQDDSEATTIIEEGTVELEVGVPTKEEQLEIHSKDSFSSTEIDNSSTHSQPSADQFADVAFTHSAEDQISFEINPPEDVATNVVTPGKARKEGTQETITEVSVSQMESLIEGSIPPEEPIADVNVPQEEPVTKASLLREESLVEGNAPRQEPVTEANFPQEQLVSEAYPQEERITQVNEESLLEVNAPQEELVTSKNEPTSTLSIEHKDIDTEPSGDGIINSDELPSAANDPHVLNTDVTSIEHPNSPYIPPFMVTTIGYSSTSDEPSATESPVDDQRAIAREELLAAPAIQVESSVTLQTDNEAPLDDSQLPARPWTPSYSVHSQGTPLVTAKELDDDESDVPLAELWTPSYSVHSQGTPLLTANELDNEDANDLVDNSGSVDAYEPKPEETKFTKTEQSEASPDSRPDEPQIQDSGPTPQYDLKEETRELLGAVNPLEKELNLVTKEEVSTSEIISDEQNKLKTGMGTSRDIPTVVTEEISTEEVKRPVDQLEGRSHSPSWVSSYSVSSLGSPLPEARELQAIVEAGSPITLQDSFEAAQSTPEHVHTPVISVSVPPVSTELSTDEGHVQSERLESKQCLDEPTIHDQLSEIPTPVLIPSMDAEGSQTDMWTPSYSVTTQGVAQSHVEIFDVSSGSSSAAIGPLGEAAHDPNEPSPSLTSDIFSNALATIDEQSNTDAFQSDIFNQLAIGQPTLLNRHPSELVSEPRLASTGDETPTQTAVVLDKHAVVDVETPPDGLSHHIFPSADDTPHEGAPDSKDKPVVPRLVPLEKCSNDTLHPEPSARKRLESTTSSRFFPGGWFSSSSTKSPDESRPSLELAQGEFIPNKSPADTEGIVSAVSPATTESFGDAREADSASSEEKRKWCIIM